ncbi:protein-disulfide reductase DsbD family protein [Xanthomonas hortorum]|uniref:Cytochrome C biogenesis protein n=1 Tax=Xanthomonas hortorum pv. pelargonii TaxID=453602 RepID=A0A6V7BTG2_9XANT|nr:protein-disulfide reductase DsbD [Xanthomonas hortorum]MCE4353762.1 protein-disulfide reductase DsbD [Xanthomonas hortorum pv. pelargonii]MCM5522662.1 protein-disulfide reductase DsbD [Xanthomonas hortorum pv. pelargonii]MCM5535631.1 protein-disulfide reductase DsbD [Xanthomonas hortorum pv. pelargonii]MCM5538904.1 protein-disulfide reductase DsbD [Xanthomonas hortorum pv. pelargonii]MCM5543587.1 protein-disulfide reductase DsbD [Xanthomonas hortorum pv. pelargonii]
MKSLSRWIARCALLAVPLFAAPLALVAPLPAQAAVTEADLLPVDQAFTLSATADSRDSIALSWKIAPGYYLYRHRISVKSGQGFAAGELALPEGQSKHDEFFGQVQTYRKQLQAKLAGKAEPSLQTAVLQVQYQGCADAGVCYPPQRRELRVSLPEASAVSASSPAAAPAAQRENLGSLVPRAPAAAPRLFGSPGQAAGVDALPLPAEQAFTFEAIVGDGNSLLLRFTPAPGYYIYRDRTSLALEGAGGVRTGLPRWPQGKAHRDEHFGDVVVYFDQAEVTLPLLRDHAEPAKVTLVATFQGCQTDGICYPPMTRRVALELPPGTVSPQNQAQTAPLMISPLAAGQTPSEPAPAARPATSAAPAADASAGNPQRTQPPHTEKGLLAMLVLALLGGLVLNLMPCVLPILSLKVLGLAHSGESRSHARSHAIWYSLGVLVSFAAIGGLVIGLRAAGQAAGWGFQLQQPWFVAALAYLMFAVGLSLSGVFTLGSNLGGIGQSLASRNGPLGDFFTGVLACVVASPCIAPFMGTALAYAFTAPALLAMLVFLALGLGLALPFLLIGFIPSLARRLPTPGAWMETLKQVLAFPMYLTAIWLLWVLGKQRGVDALALMLVGATLLALGLFCFERSRWKSHRIGMGLAAVMLVLAIVPVVAVTRLSLPAATAAEGVVTFSPQLLDRLRADNRVVFVNMTADWCVTCKANEKNVLSSAEFRDALRRVDAVYMKGDWTNVDPKISAFLDQHQAVGVPLYVVYGPGTPPAVLPTVLTNAITEDALLRAAR